MNQIVTWMLKMSPMLGIFDWIWTNDDAAKAKTAYEFLSQHQDVLQYNDFFGYVWNNIAWLFIKWLFAIAEGARKLVDGVFGIGKLLENSALNNMYTTLAMGVGMMLLVISLIWVGIRMAVSNKAPQISTVIVQAIVSVLLLIFGGPLINQLAAVSQNAFKDVAGQTQTTDSLPLSVIHNNTLDLLVVADKGFAAADKGNWGSLNYFTTKKGAKLSGQDLFLQTDMTYVLTPDVVDKIVDKDAKGSSQIANLKYKLGTDDEGNQTAIPVPTDDGIPFIQVYKPGYTRFVAHRGIISLSLIGVTVAYLFTAFTIAGAFIDLIFSRLYGVLAISTDLDSGQRTKQVISDIFNALLVIWFSGIEIRVYEMILSAMPALKLSGAVQVILIIVATFTLFKGSQAASKYFGVDTGLKRGMGSMMAAFGLAAGASKVIGGTKNLASKGLNAIRKNDGADTPSAEQNSGENPENERIPGADLNKPSVMDHVRSGAGKLGQTVGYVGAAGATGLAADAGHKVVDTAVGAKNAVVNKARDVKDAVGSVGTAYSEANQAGQAKAEERHGVQAPVPSANSQDVETTAADQTPGQREGSAVKDQADRLATDGEGSTEKQGPNVPEGTVKLPSTAPPSQNTDQPSQASSAAAETIPKGEQPKANSIPGEQPDTLSATSAAAKSGPESTKQGRVPDGAVTSQLSATGAAAPRKNPDVPLGDMGTDNSESQLNAPEKAEKVRIKADKAREVTVEGNTQNQVKTTMHTSDTPSPTSMGTDSDTEPSIPVSPAAPAGTTHRILRTSTRRRSVAIDQDMQVINEQIKQHEMGTAQHVPTVSTDIDTNEAKGDADNG